MDLHEFVRQYEKEKRYNHTLGVEKEAYELGKIFLPEKCDKLALCGLLHDITKNFDTETQLEFCKTHNIVVDEKYLSPKLLHAKTGCLFAREKLGKEIIDDEIYNGILYHTTGRENMTLFETLIYLADYIEPTRTFEDCVKLRDYFYKNIEKAKNRDEKLDVLRKTMIYSFTLTIEGLIEENHYIDNDTILARNYFLKNEKCFE